MDITIICAILFGLMAYAIYQMFEGAILKEPLNKSGSKTLHKMSAQVGIKDFWRKHPWIDLLRIVSKRVYLSESRAHTLSLQLSRINSLYTPQEYTARTWCVAGVGGILVTIAALANQPIIALVLAALTGYVMLKYRDEVLDETNRLNRSIRKELPQFVRTIAASMSGERDLLCIIRRYLKIAGPDFKRELEILLMDMNTGNAQQALQKFDAKINIPEVSRLTAVLINIERGVDQTAALTYLASDMVLMAREDLRIELNKRPKKMKRATIPCALVAVGSMFYVFIANLLDVFSGVF